MIKIILIRASLSELHSNVENGTVVYAQRITAKNRIATYYCSLMYSGSCTNMMNLWILHYKYFTMQKYLASCTDIPYQAGTVNHATMNKTEKITDTMFVWHMQWRPLAIHMKTDYRKMPGHTIKKGYTWSSFIMLKVYLLQTAQM